MTEQAAVTAKKEQKPRHRSPNYPNMSLRSAVSKIDAIYKADRLAPSPKSAALRHMGYEKLHSEAARSLSALKSFGLIEETPDDRVKLTQRGVEIVVRPKGDKIREEAIRKAALGPDIYRELVAQYPSGLISDISLRSDLITIRKFNPTVVDGFIRDLKETFEFAGLSDFGVLDSQQQRQDEVPPPVSPQVGDYVQWAPNGELRFPEPKRFRGLSPDGQWGFVDGQNSGLPVKELTVVKTQVLEKPVELTVLPLDPIKTKTENPLTPSFAPTMRSYSFPLSGDLSAKLELFGEARTADDLDALAEYIELTIKALKRSLKDQAQIQSGTS